MAPFAEQGGRPTDLARVNCTEACPADNAPGETGPRPRAKDGGDTMMEELIREFVADLASPWLFGLVALCLAVLGKSANWLVRQAVVLSERSGVPKTVIGASILLEVQELG